MKPKKKNYPFKRDLKKTNVQVTFEGDKHPTSGCVFGFTWYDLKLAIESRLPADDRVISFKITDRGLDVYHDKLMTVGEGLEIHSKITGRKYK